MGVDRSEHTADALLEALDSFVLALEASSERTARALEKAKRFRRLREQGLSCREIVAGSERPLMVELATSNLDALYEAGGRFRREEAEALHRDGLTMDRIAELFGVSRQRVSALLRQARRPV